MEKYRIEQVGSTIASSSGLPKVAWPTLKAAQFRHPLDSQATITVQRLFPFENLVRQAMGGMLEEMVYLDNMSNGIKVGKNQLPKIYKRLKMLLYIGFISAALAPLRLRAYLFNSLSEAKKIMGLQDVSVDLFVRQNPVPNAYTMALQVNVRGVYQHQAQLLTTV